MVKNPPFPLPKGPTAGGERSRKASGHQKRTAYKIPQLEEEDAEGFDVSGGGDMELKRLVCASVAVGSAVVWGFGGNGRRNRRPAL